MRDPDDLFTALARSNFRCRFKLTDREVRYVREKGFHMVEQHACDFVHSRLASANPANDGKQTPMKNHPVFIAQHATATCCRGCLEKWHYIPRGRPLSEEEIDSIVAVIMRWIKNQPLKMVQGHQNVEKAKKSQLFTILNRDFSAGR